ncbi:hypothetical protein F7725_018942 [Dissostichus mawsoni]|uniref:SNF-related serine/threonine-protein kinase n=1 Tax=Dissostichus mawsoni TaxID=36200 RepID=A0A7J5XSX8_DISMA|nr:hypothetical protein F7725_018942 [Dissostichus mawsoni]
MSTLFSAREGITTAPLDPNNSANLTRPTGGTLLSPSPSPAMAGFKRGYDGKIAGLYDLDKTLGRGHFAVVKLARHVFTGEKVAVKVIDKTKLDTVATGHLFQEVRCMKLVQHPNIVRLYEVIDTQTKLYLILELGDGGDMFDYIMNMRRIVHAISYCHRLHVVHRDLKPENVVFFEKQGLVKLTDFGFSNKFQPGKKLTTSCGSLAYSAPEILLGDEYDAPAVDIWSLGVILFMLVCGQPPFQEANDSETLTMIMDCKYSVPDHVSSACKDLIDRMLQRDPKHRASLEEIEGHAWLQGVDPSPATKFNTPLVSHKNLSDEEHNSIIQRMVLGDIADREAIVEILREKQEKEVQTRSSSPSNTKAHFRTAWQPPPSPTLGPPVPRPSIESLLNGHRSKGLLHLGRRDETGACAAGTPRAPAPSTSAAAKQRGCLFRVAEDEEDEEEQDPATIHSQSAPVLNQIFEEGESDDDFDLDEGLPPKLSRLKMNMAGNAANLSSGASPGATHKRYHRRKSQGRGSSCSSSETSDDDSESHRRRLDKDSGFGYGWNRRDSSEGPPGSSGGNGGAAARGPVNLLGREGGPPAQTRGVLLEVMEERVVTEEAGEVAEGGVGEVGGRVKDRTVPPAVQEHEPLPQHGAGGEPEADEPVPPGPGGARGGGPPGGTVKIQEKSAWRMCIGSTGSLDTITLPATALPRPHAPHRKTAAHGPSAAGTLTAA